MYYKSVHFQRRAGKHRWHFVRRPPLVHYFAQKTALRCQNFLPLPSGPTQETWQIFLILLVSLSTLTTYPHPHNNGKHVKIPNPTLIPYETHQSYRQLFPHTEQGLIYLNHAAVSPLSTRVLKAQIAHLQDRSTGKIETYPDDVKQLEKTKGCIERLINAESWERIALAGNTSDALNIVAAGLDWKPGDRILLNDLEFPANVYPYYHLKSHGVEIDVIHSSDGKLTAEMVYEALRPRTRLLALSAVQFLSGYRSDLAVLGELCRSRGILFVVDAMQAVGGMRIDVQEMKIDAVAAGAPKWQMGPQGIGFLYLTEELQSRVHQKYLGWLSVENPWDFFNFDQAPATTARRYEGGTVNIPAMWGYHASLSTILEIGPDVIESHILSLTGALTRQFLDAGLTLYSPTDDQERAGIVTILPPKGVEASAAYEELARERVLISARGGKLRYSPHFYNSIDEIRSAAAISLDVFARLSSR
ncbi:MAG TPA: aminotransferase [Bacteroidetes bacterium]|nr:aminotransferase [Bacteroidota bacterium]